MLPCHQWHLLKPSPLRKWLLQATAVGILIGAGLMRAFMGPNYIQQPSGEGQNIQEAKESVEEVARSYAHTQSPSLTSQEVCEAERSDLASMHNGLIVSHKKELDSHKRPQRQRTNANNDKFVHSAEFAEMKKYIIDRHPDIEQLQDQFARDGYIVFKPDIPTDVLEGAAAFTQSIYDICSLKTKELPADTDRHCGNYHQDRYDEVEVVKQLADDYHIRAMLAMLHNDEPYPFQTLNYPGTSLARTHSDWIHFAAEPIHLMSAAWCALEDVNPDAGPVFYHPGTHKLPVFTMQDFGLEAREAHPLNYAKYQDVMEHVMSASESKPHYAVIKKGHCLIWSSNLVHGGPQAKQQGLTRLSQVTHYFFKGALYNWAPVMSDVNKEEVVYYVPEQINAKWRRNGETFEETKRLSKFRTGDCSQFHPNPCAKLERIPKVLSQMLRHDVSQGESVM